MTKKQKSIVRFILMLIRVIVLALLGLSAFFWLAFHGSGHIIPRKTDQAFAICTASLIILLLLLVLVSKNIKRKARHDV